MRQPSVAVLDYGSGNLRSVVRALQSVGADVVVGHQPEQVLTADGLVVPGVGAFEACMRGLKRVKGERLIDQRLAGGRSVLGICVGMQILFEAGDEHGLVTDGCRQWPGRVQRLNAPVLPHMGWNTVQPPVGSELFAGLADQRFYFVHSYAALDMPVTDPGTSAVTPPAITWTEYGQRFVSAVENGVLCGTQFHPEKSGDAGLELLSNWLLALR